MNEFIKKSYSSETSIQIKEEEKKRTREINKLKRIVEIIFKCLFTYTKWPWRRHSAGYIKVIKTPHLRIGHVCTIGVFRILHDEIRLEWQSSRNFKTVCVMKFNQKIAIVPGNLNMVEQLYLHVWNWME